MLHIRPTADRKQLAPLYRKPDLKYFGDYTFFELLIKDLKFLEERDIMINDGRVMMVQGHSVLHFRKQPDILSSFFGKTPKLMTVITVRLTKIHL